MKLFILLFCFLPLSVYSQQTDSFVDSLFYSNITVIHEKCQQTNTYNPFLDGHPEIYEFLTIFSYISGIHLIGICYEPAITNLEKVIELEQWYKKYGCCITKQDYLNFKRVIFEITSFKSIDEWDVFQEHLFNNHLRKLKEFENKYKPDTFTIPNKYSYGNQD